jgi:hypothetical protein
MDKVDVAFISPPWGGISYAYGDFDLANDIPMGMYKWVHKCLSLSHSIAVFLPRNVQMS